jgi:Tfp pilus assembly protein PilN
MITVNLLKDHSAPVEKKQQKILNTSKASLVGYAYIAAIIIFAAALGYWRVATGNAIEKAAAENQRLDKEVKSMEALRKQFVELEQKQQERQARVNIIEKLLESQKGPVKLLNVLIQSIPQNHELWLTSLEQNAAGVKIKGETENPEILPEFLESLEKSGIFNSVDIEQIERRNEISSFSIVCAGRK